MANVAVQVVFDRTYSKKGKQIKDKATQQLKKTTPAICGKVNISFPSLGDIIKPIGLTVQKVGEKETLNAGAPAIDQLDKRFKAIIEEGFNAYWSINDLLVWNITIDIETFKVIDYNTHQSKETKKDTSAPKYNFTVKPVKPVK